MRKNEGFGTSVEMTFFLLQTLNLFVSMIPSLNFTSKPGYFPRYFKSNLIRRDQKSLNNGQIQKKVQKPEERKNRKVVLMNDKIRCIRNEYLLKVQKRLIIIINIILLNSFWAQKVVMNLNKPTIPYILQHGTKIFSHPDGQTIYRVEQEQASFCCQIISLPDYSSQLGDKKAQELLQHIKATYQEHFELARKVESPHVLKYLKLVTIDRYVCIIQETFDMTLSQYMRKRNNQLTYEEKMKIMEKIFSAVQCLTEGKIAHRSLHPDNIVVCHNGSQKPTFKICNFMDSFDLSQRIPEGNNTPNSITEYTAPEIKQFKRHSEKVDVWSLGMLLYWMLFAQTYSVMVNIEGQQNEQGVVVKCHENTPKWLCSFINKLLAFLPEDRYNIHDAIMTLHQAVACADTTGKIMDSIPLSTSR